MEKPDFIFLDEPTNGLDAEGINLVHNIILEESKRGALIIIASHNREDIEKLCNITYTMQEGKLMQEEPLCENGS
ncbi:ABC transporter ATP-binding protein YtrB [compost metagenome]